MSNLTIATAVVPTCFVYFLRLPMEIQVLIWRAARPEPRFIKLRGSPNHNGGDHDVYSTAPIPLLLHTCRDSRYEALKWYQLSFGNATFPSSVYFDWEKDGLRTRCHGCAGGNQCSNYHIAFNLLQDQDRVAIKRLLWQGLAIRSHPPWHAVTVNYPGAVDLYLAESLLGNDDPRNNQAIDESQLRAWERMTLSGMRPVLTNQVAEYAGHMSFMITWGFIPAMPLLNLREVRAVIVDYNN